MIRTTILYSGQSDPVLCVKPTDSIHSTIHNKVCLHTQYLSMLPKAHSGKCQRQSSQQRWVAQCAGQQPVGAHKSEIDSYMLQCVLMNASILFFCIHKA